MSFEVEVIKMMLQIIPWHFMVNEMVDEQNTSIKKVAQASHPRERGYIKETHLTNKSIQINNKINFHNRAEIMAVLSLGVCMGWARAGPG